jgi:hypothetical protein
MHTDIHISSGIQTNNPSVWAGEDSSCLDIARPLWSPTFITKGILIFFSIKLYAYEGS